MINAIVRVSFQSDPEANQLASETLTGHRMATTSLPFTKLLNTAVYHCQAGSDHAVLSAVAALLTRLRNEKADVVDYVSITLVRLPDPSP